MSIWSSINCPTVICLPIVCYFSREKPLVKPTAPKSLSHIICLRDLFYLPFIFRSIKPKIQKYLAAIYFIWRSIYQYLQLSHVCLPISRRRYPKGIDNLFYTPGCEYLLFVWFDNLSLTTERNTYHRCAASSLPLWGNTDVALSRNLKEFLAPLPGNIKSR